MTSIPRNFRDFFYHIYYYREYLKQSIARDLRKRYKRSVLGYCWSMLQPLLMMVILSLVFSKIMQSRAQEYSVFLFTAMIPWQYFSGTVKGCLDAIRSNARIIDQVAVPKYIFPLSTAFSSLCDFLLSLFPLLLVMLIVGRPFHLSILALPILIPPLFMVSMGIALLFAVSNVFFEDTQHLVVVLLQALYFLCPVLYARDHLPEWLIKYLLINPMFSIIEFSRDIFYNGTLPNMNSYFLVLTASALILAFGLWVFRKAEDKFLYFI